MKNPPQGQSWLSPVLIVRNVKEAVAFYGRMLDFKPVMVLDTPDGNAIHACIAFNGMNVFLSPTGGMDNNPIHQAPVSSKNESPASFYLYRDDLDALYEKCKSEGLQIMQEPADQFWGERTFAIKDPEGYYWMFAKCVAEFDPSMLPEGMTISQG